MIRETQIEESLIGKLTDLKYTYRQDIRDRETLEKNFRQKLQALNRVNLTDAEFMRLRDEIINSDVFASSKHSTTQSEKEINLKEVNKQLVEIEKRAAKAAKKHNKFLKELGLPPI